MAYSADYEQEEAPLKVLKGLYSKILVLLLIVGACLLIYPSFAEWWNSRFQLRDISDYLNNEAQLTEENYDEEWEKARMFNQAIFNHHKVAKLTDEERELYNSCLNIGSNGVMGYVDIPIIRVSLPIYHGTSDVVLQTGVGHMESTSLPVGGENTHAALSGHRGLISANLFTNLDRVAEGDLFMLRVLGETLTYKVDKISIVLPSETKLLEPVEGMDYCTLVTCTPYGINSHRLLVRGHRVPNINNLSLTVAPDAMQIDPILISPLFAAPMLLALLIRLILKKR